MTDNKQAFNATFYRTALLLGLIRGEVVHHWAEQVIANEAKPPAAFIDLIGVPVDDLSEMRHALWPLVIDPPPPEVLHAILGLLHEDLAGGRCQLSDTITILRQMRSMLKLPTALYAELNDTLVTYETGPNVGAVADWLQPFEAVFHSMASNTRY